MSEAAVVDPHFVGWEERIVCHERGNRVVHFYLKHVSGDLALAVIGTEPSIRHMLFTVQDDFVSTYGFGLIINGCTKWRARREVVEWLSWLISLYQPLDYLNPQEMESIEALGSLKFAGQDEMVPRKFETQTKEIVWSGVSWSCSKQLQHYPAFSRNGITIPVHSFVFVMAEGKSHYLGYLEDLYENKKGLKKVKVRWFHLNQEVKVKFSHLGPHPREVFITPHAQSISAECIDGFASILTPQHYEKCLSVLPNALSYGVYMCSRQLKDNKVKPFTLTKLHGYANQTILAHLTTALVAKQKSENSNVNEQEDGEEFSPQDPVRPNAESSKACGVKFVTSNNIMKCESTYPKLKIILPTTTTGLNIDKPKPLFPFSLSVNEKIELLSQDSGIRGCWFKCKILKTSKNNLKIQYDDLEDVDGRGKLQEWVPAYRVAAPDKLGMRCPGRLTIRPRPLEARESCLFFVGTPVDAWWSDGWWEGVVTLVSTDDSLKVFFPGEKVFRTIKMTDVRTSRDWMNNAWVDIKAKPDILSCIPELLRTATKLPSCSTAVEQAKQSGFAHRGGDDNGRVNTGEKKVV